MSDSPIFALFITKSPYDSRNAESALAFCEAAVALGYKVKHVFFYQAGVHNSSKHLCVNTDEVSVKDRWQALNAQHKIPLYLCVTAGTRRGIVTSHSEDDTTAACFTSVGMSEYFASLHDDSIKSIQF
ncbi:sulfurtransferase complex subunit TusD [Glaciecola sp. XM2]|uniref:sulfurtransferase complex subunit TusD n=1 Tax=Glaciecola sp. XM2 TaxID=1914931 RepID=UPI001BDDFDE6|nr:sulfurtransferase complex subunit TusD [Glaciecola sp. XM2]MBT1449619.1 sulfurtransferase complex subunit TusD [Glaciecola sp. XM2]